MKGSSEEFDSYKLAAERWKNGYLHHVEEMKLCWDVEEAVAGYSY